MSILQAVVLGVVQGLTEFLPISSSGHLVAVPALLGWDIPQSQAFIFDVLVQVGTLVAVFAYFWTDLVRIAGRMLAGIRARQPFQDESSRLGWMLLVATLPAGIAGLLIKDQVEAAFSSPRMTAGFLLVTAALLVLAERFAAGRRAAEDVRWFDALVVGTFQILAIFPGVSRSGSTITGGMTRGLSRSQAARFSFLMAIPIMLAAGLLSTLDLLSAPGATDFLPALAAGFLTSAVTGYLAIRWLVGYLKNGSLYGFAVYVTALAVVIFLLAG